MKRPNIISITCHDLGRHISCYGIDTVQTPNLDRMAAEGVRFSSSFCTSPGCSPSRASLYTGRYPHNNGVMGLTHANFAWDLNPGESHLVQYLTEAGYRSALFGGQHETRNPEKLGFTDVMEDCWRPCEEVVEDAVSWLSANKYSQNPIYMQVGFFEPHRKFNFGKAEPDSSKGVTVPDYLIENADSIEEFASYQGAIKKVDSAIGKLLDNIAQADLDKNTIIMFTTDHGIPFPRAKCTLYDPGIEVAHIVKWSGKSWSDGRVVPELISNIDHLPSLLDLLDIPIPDNIQGKSYMPLLEEKEYEERKVIFAEKTYHGYCDPMRCVRTRDYKLIVNFTAAPALEDSSQSYHSKTITVEPKDPAYAYHEPLELYDLKNDILEHRNLANNMECRNVCNGLLSELYKWMMETNDPLLKGIPLPPMYKLAIDALKNT